MWGYYLIQIISQSVFEKNTAWARIGEAERARRQASEAERGRFGVERVFLGKTWADGCSNLPCLSLYPLSCLTRQGMLFRKPVIETRSERDMQPSTLSSAVVIFGRLSILCHASRFRSLPLSLLTEIQHKKYDFYLAEIGRISRDESRRPGVLMRNALAPKKIKPRRTRCAGHSLKEFHETHLVCDVRVGEMEEEPRSRSTRLQGPDQVHRGPAATVRGCTPRLHQRRRLETALSFVRIQRSPSALDGVDPHSRG